jgi:hypothetical protein
MSKVLREFGIEIPPEEDTPLMRQLVALIEQLVEENHRLRGIPSIPDRPKPAPSALHDPITPPSKQGGKPGKKRKNRKGRNKGIKSSKFKNLKITETITLPSNAPPEARLVGYKSFIQQELRLEIRNIRYRRPCYENSDGTISVTPRPENLLGHYGPSLRAHILYQYYQNNVTEPLIHKELQELGVKISMGQISNMVTQDHDQFHHEKDDLLPAAREVSTVLHTDDTTARHLGKNAHTLQIGNELFASFVTTWTKSRINFLEILRSPYTDYVLSGDTVFYLEYFELPNYVLAILNTKTKDYLWTWESEKELIAQLRKWGIHNADHHQRIVEATLWGSLLEHGLYADVSFMSDGATTYKLLWFGHGLCWLHCERSVSRMIPLDSQQKRAYDTARDDIWRYYQRLKKYRDNPTERTRQRLESDFDVVFLKQSRWPELNDVMRAIHQKKSDLLLVLEHPEVPLHNNLSENDIRQFAKLRKISGSSRSELGRRCRDTFLSLKTTCRKLAISFRQFLQDRINGLNEIPPLGDIIRQRGSAATGG